MSKLILAIMPYLFSFIFSVVGYYYLWEYAGYEITLCIFIIQFAREIEAKADKLRDKIE